MVIIALLQILVRREKSSHTVSHENCCVRTSYQTRILVDWWSRTSDMFYVSFSVMSLTFLTRLALVCTDARYSSLPSQCTDNSDVLWLGWASVYPWDLIHIRVGVHVRALYSAFIFWTYLFLLTLLWTLTYTQITTYFQKDAWLCPCVLSLTHQPRPSVTSLHRSLRFISFTMHCN